MTANSFRTATHRPGPRSKSSATVATAVSTVDRGTAPAGTRIATEHRIALSDGCELFYRSWAPRRPTTRAVILFHRGHEHSLRWQETVDQLGLDDYWVFAWDARGHGRSEGERGYAESFARMVQDANEFVEHVSSEHEIPVEEMAVMAQSVGAVLAAAWVHDYAPPIRALILATPAFRVKLYVPFAIPGLRLLNRIRRKAFIRSYVKPRMLTHDPEQARAYEDDPLISPQIAVNILLDLHDASTRLIADAGAIRVPTLMLLSGSDWVVKNDPQLEFFERLGSPVKSLKTYPEFFHSTFWEEGREEPIARSRDFIVGAFRNAPPDRSDLVHADQSSPEQATYERLRLALPRFSPSRLAYAAQRFALATVGRLSRGIQVGWRTGFDSGESLDHVYGNKARGLTPLGKLIDRGYLDAPGWKGIRQRKVHLEQLFDSAMAQVVDSTRNVSVESDDAKEVRILDVAAGPGRYVLDSIDRNRDHRIDATLCDRDLGGLEAGRKLAASMGIDSVTYRENDAFDGDAIAGLADESTPFDIAIASGLYELFPSNAPIQQSLDGLRRAVRSGGFLIYTNQPWHPQQELIARVLPNRDGQPWAMRCRSQAEMDALVTAAGFRKVAMRIDEAGIFSVSLAVRNS